MTRQPVKHPFKSGVYLRSVSMNAKGINALVFALPVITGNAFLELTDNQGLALETDTIILPDNIFDVLHILQLGNNIVITAAVRYRKWLPGIPARMFVP